MNKQILRIAQISVAVLLSVIAGFGWMLPAELRRYDMLLMTLSLMGTGFGASVIIGDRWRTHWLTGTLLLMLVPALISLVVSSLVLENRLSWLGKFASLMSESMFEIVGYLAVTLIILAILSPYFLLPRYRSVWVGLFVFIVTVTLLVILETDDVLNLGYLKFHLLMLALFASVAAGMWWKSGTESDNSEQSIIGQVIKLNNSKAAFRLHPALILVMLCIGILFGAAWYRRYDHMRDYIYENNNYKVKHETPIESVMGTQPDTIRNDSSIVCSYSKSGMFYNDGMEEYIRLYYLNEKEFNDQYGGSDELLFRRPGDHSFVTLEEQETGDPTTQRAHLIEMVHDLTITQLTGKGFKFKIQSATTPGACTIKGEAQMVSFDEAKAVRFESESIVTLAKDSVNGCDITFRFFKNGLILYDRGCRSVCGANVTLGDVYVLDIFSRKSFNNQEE